MTYMIYLVDMIFENRVAQITYMKNMSRKREIQKVDSHRLDFGDKFRSVLCRFADRLNWRFLVLDFEFSFFRGLYVERK